MTLARDPNVADDALRTWRWAGYENATVLDELTLSFGDTTAGARWFAALHSDAAQERSDELWLHAYTKFDWRDAYVRLTRIDTPTSAHDSTGGSIQGHSTGDHSLGGHSLGRHATGRHSTGANYTLHRDPTTVPQYAWVSGSRFYATGALALLDAPGEYLVLRNGTLYFVPPSGEGRAAEGGEGGESGEVVVSRLETAISASGAEHVSWRNLAVGYARAEAMHLSGRHLTLANLSVTNAGGACIALDGENNSLSASNVSGCGRAGVSLTGGDERTLARANSSVVGNAIANCSRIVRTYMPNVGFRGVGLLIAGNVLRHAPHAMVQGGGNDCLFEHNLLSRAAYETTDVGAFYVGRSWAQRGNVVRFNTFDTVRPTERLAQGGGVSQNAFYLDDQMSGWDFYGNTIRNSSVGVLLGGGRHNRIHDNLFLGNDFDVRFDDRGLGWQAASCAYNCTGTTTSCFRYTLDNLNYTSPPYATAYPLLPTIYDDHPCVPVGNIIEDNRFCHQTSKHGGQFIDRTEDTIRKWRSSISNNVEDCTSNPV